MRRPTSTLGVLLAGVVVLGLGGLIVGGVAAADALTDGPSPDVDGDADDGMESEENETRTSPGERLSGVVGVGAAEIDGDLESRSYERSLGENRSDEERADAIAERLDRNAERLDEIEARQNELEELREAGEISEGEYRARIARLTAETRAIERTTNRSASAAEEVPREQLEARGVDAERVETLRTRAKDLSGPEVSEIAREIAGPNVGGAPDRPEHAGPPTANDTRGGGPAENASEYSGGPGEDRAGNTSQGSPGDTGSGSADDRSQGPPENTSGSDTAGGEAGSDSSQGTDDNGSTDASGGPSNDALSGGEVTSGPI